MRYWVFKKNLAAAMLSIALVFCAQKAKANEESGAHSTVCDEATAIASNEYQVPLSVLKAIARTESGLTFKGKYVPWPWSLNIEGRGLRLGSLEETIASFQKSYNAGYRNIDVGCFQINHKWHGENFSSVEEMLQPLANARYAARFLQELHSEFGDWVSAVGAYHSRNTETSEIYLAKFIPILKQQEGQQPQLSSPLAAVRQPNNFPLLKGRSQSRTNGSLFPSNSASRGSLFGSMDVRG